MIKFCGRQILYKNEDGEEHMLTLDYDIDIKKIEFSQNDMFISTIDDNLFIFVDFKSNTNCRIIDTNEIKKRHKLEKPD
jgi:hypothetical protein